ncbi:hypothetical protein GWK26_11850 [haloarchaeon 3A1-DGR]|nr:hypothetical protein GWK26_11850 [haloarchaeon 3A1-DGR]
MVAQSDSDGDTASAAARDLTLDQLAAGGQKPSNAPDSIRANGRYGEFAVKTLPTGLLVDESEQSPSWRYLRDGETVKRNYVQLWSKRAYGESNQDYVVEIAHFTVGQQTVQTEQGTRTERVAQNVTTYSRSVTFSGGYDYAEIDLQPHYDEKVRTVMCTRQPNEASCLTNPDETRWQFFHSSSRATLPIETNSAGGRLGWGILSLLLPFFGATVTTLYAGRKAVARAKAGPQISAIWWVLVAVGGMLFIVIAWDWLSGTLIRAPWLVAIAGGILLGVIAVEWFGRTTFGAAFLQFRLEDGFDPTDPDAGGGDRDGDGGDSQGIAGEAPGVLKAKLQIANFAQGEKGERSAIRSGVRRFWARARGASADFETDGNMLTRIDVDGPLEEIYLLDPEADEPLQYEPEHHALEWPDLVTYDDDGNRRIHPVPWVAGAAALGMGWLGGSLLTGSGPLGLFTVGLALFAFKVARPRDGELFANLAPIHYHHAVAAMLTHAKGVADAKSWDEWYTEYVRESASTQADKSELLDDRSKSQMDELFDRYVEAGESDAPIRDDGASSGEASADD